jgi:hypothetical protein
MSRAYGRLSVTRRIRPAGTSGGAIPVTVSHLTEPCQSAPEPWTMQEVKTPGGDFGVATGPSNPGGSSESRLDRHQIQTANGLIEWSRAGRASWNRSLGNGNGVADPASTGKIDRCPGCRCIRGVCLRQRDLKLWQSATIPEPWLCMYSVLPSPPGDSVDFIMVEQNILD